MVKDEDKDNELKWKGEKKTQKLGEKEKSDKMKPKIQSREKD